jgi:thioesterase domain-containing protein
MVHHGSLSHFLGSMADQPGLLASDRLVAATSLSFDIAALELYLPLVLGAQVILADQSTVRDGRLLAQLLTESQATVFQATPAGWRMLLAGGWSYQQQTAIAGTTFKGLCGGEALPPDLARTLTDKGVELWNMYGPTETTIWSMVKRVGQVPPTLGRPIAATQVQVLDADLNPCPPGVPGELYLGGVGLARGYLNRAGLTAERFIAALNSSAGERIYRTGDLVRWTPEGELEYLGRLDQQVKIRGFRIELGEVEAQVMALSMVRAAAVVAMDGVAGACLAAYVVPIADVTDPGAFRATLRARLAETLPDHMVPGVVEILEEMPLTPNGKVDRKALPQPLPASAEACDPPRGESELALARIWSSLLKVEQVGRHNNFFQLGGHSLLALQMVNRAQALHLFNPPLKLHDVIAAPTIALLCGRKASDRADEIVAPLNGISVGKDPLFCIHSGWGTTMGYLPLAQRLDGICTVYGISSRVLHDPASRHRYLTLEKMADDYTAVIRRIQVRGPYSILGWSLGGTLAAMVAARLEAGGDEVAFLGLVDPYMAAMEPPQNDLTWQMRYVRFLAGISSKMTPQWTVPATIGDPFEQEDALAQTTAALLDDGRLSLLGDFEGASAAEIVRLFLTNYSVQLASMASVAPLPALRADTRCWWVTERLDKAVAMARLAKELNCAIEHLSVDADHLGIIADHGLLDAVAGTLSMPLQSLT